MSDGEDRLPLIRTGLRDKLAAGLSHPVGAESISKALAGCPIYDQLWTAFGSKLLPVRPAPADAGDFRLAFTVVCNNNSGDTYLSVPAVPSEVRTVVRQVLTVRGLPAVQDWLCQARPATWREGFRTFQVGYALNPLRVCLVESLNDRVVSSSVAAFDEAKPVSLERGAAQPAVAADGRVGRLAPSRARR
jgi:hypothetical protein